MLWIDQMSMEQPTRSNNSLAEQANLEGVIYNTQSSQQSVKGTDFNVIAGDELSATGLGIA